jgi:hypothetical protein
MLVFAGAKTAEQKTPPTAVPALKAGCKDWATREQDNLSEYYVKTEGLLLEEFGNFLGKICDRIDQQIQKESE